jgi:hypothetical protein
LCLRVPKARKIAPAKVIDKDNNDVWLPDSYRLILLQGPRDYRMAEADNQ